MDPLQTQLFNTQDSDGIRSYNIRLIPPEPLFSQVTNFKKEFIDSYGEQLLTKSKPHITLAKFVMSTSFQKLLVEYFKSLGQTKKFVLKLRGFDTVESSGTLLLQINPSEELGTLLRTIGNLKRTMLHHKVKNFGLSYTPHLTIASMLDPVTLQASLNHFKNIAYPQQPFEVDHLIITSRKHGKTWDWEHRIDFS